MIFWKKYDSHLKKKVGITTEIVHEHFLNGKNNISAYLKI